MSSASVDPSEVRFHSKWSFWSAAPTKNSWEMRELFQVETLAELWQHLNAMKLPSEFGNGAVELALFRHGVQPDWEVEPCSLGGRWSARLDRVQSPDSLDQAWMNLLLGAVGESILACNDAGEAPQKGALLVARHGKGYYVYTGLGFFRQLPAGVPGAYRLFANLISLGK